ncbi:MAG TPA: methionine--tRNA ligase [Candidatus Saccharimonadales bacterium]|nr:methionine--tRNA ligase [Candidatus Saccharimonadales bacterium]
MTAKEQKYLITTAIDYTNDVIHIGHAYQKILADCVARYQRLKRGDKDVYFLTGTDEYGTTNEKAAKDRNVSPKQHVDEISARDRAQLDALNVSYDRFFRTTDEDHTKTASDFYKKVFDAGDIYKDKYKGLYCEGCESYKTFSELNEEGQCLLHPTRKIQELEEVNYFFKWSKYSDFLRALVNSERFVLPQGKKKEMLAFIENGIKDIPITRPTYKVTWGIPVPNDPEQVIYVWFDALINYFTAAKPLGFWDDSTEIVHILGKDNAKWHVLLWPAMLKSASERVPDTIYVHGFINLDGQKISKSRGNVILPTDLVNKYGVDAVRYYFLKHGPIVEDVDISIKHLEETYNSDLANGLGNTVARLAKLAENSGFEFDFAEGELNLDDLKPIEEDFRIDIALQNVWKNLADLDKHINENTPWAIKEANTLKEVLTYEITKLREVALLLQPFMPETSKQILSQFSSQKITARSALFPRLA